MNVLDALKKITPDVKQTGNIIKAKVKDLNQNDLYSLTHMSKEGNVEDLYIKRSGNGLTIIVETI
jgi:hypothetical protein